MLCCLEVVYLWTRSSYETWLIHDTPSKGLGLKEYCISGSLCCAVKWLCHAVKWVCRVVCDAADRLLIISFTVLQIALFTAFVQSFLILHASMQAGNLHEATQTRVEDSERRRTPISQEKSGAHA